MEERIPFASSHPPVLLCIGGLDPSGGAGLGADARAGRAFGAHVLQVATAIVVQDTRQVFLTEPVSPEIVAAQLETVLADIKPGAVKIGMLPGIAVTEAVAEGLRHLPHETPIVVDPVIAPSAGPAFLDAAGIDYLVNRILTHATLLTPNLPEAQALGGVSAANLDEMAQCCSRLKESTGAANVLLKGGHLDPSDSSLTNLSVDLLFDGHRFLELRALRCHDYEVRGTGCMLASAIASQLASGTELHEAVRHAKVWLTRQIREAKAVGAGRRVAA